MIPENPNSIFYSKSERSKRVSGIIYFLFSMNNFSTRRHDPNGTRDSIFRYFPGTYFNTLKTKKLLNMQKYALKKVVI